MLLRHRVRTSIACLLLLPLLAAPLRADDATKGGGALRLVPEDAAFYTASLANREQIEIILKSKAWAKLTSMPLVKQGWAQLVKEWEKKSKENKGEFNWEEWYSKEDNKELVALVGDMVSDEVFFYGGDSVNGFIDLFQKAYSAANMAPLKALMEGDFGGNANKAQGRAMFLALKNNLDLIRVPDFTLGFKLRKADVAKNQLKRLEGILEGLAKQVQLQDRLTKKKLGGGDFIVLTFDGSMVPWGKIPLEEIEEEEGEFAKVIEKLKTVKCTITLGVRGDYLLFSIASSTDHIEKLGQGKSLADRSEFKPLAKHAGKKLTSVEYTSKKLRMKGGIKKEDLDSYVKTGKELLAKIGLPDKTTKMIEKDMDDLAKDIADYITVPGAALSFSFLTSTGSETFSYTWGDHRFVDSSKPLTVLEHVGGSPILVAAGRAKYMPEEYDKFVRWLKMANRYLEEFGVPRMDQEQHDEYEKFKKVAYPLLERLDKATKNFLIPALADGQNAFVLDAKLTSKQWHKAMPEFPKPMPILEPAIVQGVSDADKLVKAFQEYRSIFNDTAKAVADAAKAKGEKIEIVEWPAPKSRKINGGTMYYYPIPEEAGLEKRLLPNATLSPDWLVLTLSQEHSERLLAKSPLKLPDGPLADLSKPRSAASYFDWVGFVDAATPWIEFGFEMAMKHPNADEWIDRKSVPENTKTVLQLMKVLRYACSSTYLEDGALVTHSQIVFKDID